MEQKVSAKITLVNFTTWYLGINTFYFILPIQHTHNILYYGLDGKESVCNAGHLGSIPGLGRSPEKEMATQYPGNFSILAWEIPWTEEPGGLQSRESQRVKHN